MKKDSRWPNLVFPDKAVLPSKDAKFDDSKARKLGGAAGKRFKKMFDPTDNV